MRVRAAVLNAPGQTFVVQPVELAPPKSQEVLVRVDAAGVCASDWHLQTGATAHPMPVIAGHEGTGTVAAVGPGVSRVAVGQRVALSWAPTCGACFQCLRSRPGLCETNVNWIWSGNLADGTSRLSRADERVFHYSALSCFAEYTVVPETSCIPFEGEIPATVAAIVGCAVATGFGAAVETGAVEAGERVLVYGVGGVGLSAVMAASAAGATTIIAVDRTYERARQALAFGATEALEDGPELAATIRSQTGGRGADVAIDTTGRPTQQLRCLEAIRPGGRVVLVGLGAGEAEMQVPTAKVIRQEKQILGCYYGSTNPARDFGRILDLYQKGRIPLENLITRTYTLDEINEAFADLNAGKLLRGVVCFGDA